jgi:hypothetical protein
MKDSLSDCCEAARAAAWRSFRKTDVATSHPRAPSGGDACFVSAVGMGRKASLTSFAFGRAPGRIASGHPTSYSAVAQSPIDLG